MYVCTSEEGYEGTYSHRHSELAMKGCRGAAWGFFALFLLHSALWAPVRSSVHEYVDGLFSNESNAFVFNGGSEGMLASTSFSHIRFLTISSLSFTSPSHHFSLAMHRAFLNTCFHRSTCLFFIVLGFILFSGFLRSEKHGFVILRSIP